MRGYSSRLVFAALLLIFLPEMVLLGFILGQQSYCRPQACLLASGIMFMTVGSLAGLAYLFSCLGKTRLDLAPGRLVVENPALRIEVPEEIVEEVREIDRVEPSLRYGGMYLFGVALGYFKVKNIGKALLVLGETGRKILVKTRELSVIASVRNTEVLSMLESLRGGAVKNIVGRRIRIVDKTKKAILVSLAIAILLLGVALNIYEKLPERVPVHYNLKGEPTRYGSKSELLIGIMVIYAIIIGFSLACLLAPKVFMGLGYLFASVNLGLSLLSLGIMPLCMIG